MIAVDDGQVEDAPLPDGEEAADFAALSRMASDDPNAVPVEGEAEAVPALPLDKEIAGALQMIVGIVGPMFPSLAAIYTTEVCESVGAAVSPVCEKYGWLQGGIGGEYGPEIMCAIVVAPLGYATYIAVNNDMEARREKSREKAATRIAGAGGVIPQKPGENVVAGALRTPGSDTVTFGAPIQ
jgi:hypothetical protein